MMIRGTNEPNTYSINVILNKDMVESAMKGKVCNL